MNRLDGLDFISKGQKELCRGRIVLKPLEYQSFRLKDSYTSGGGASAEAL